MQRCRGSPTPKGAYLGPVRRGDQKKNSRLPLFLPLHIPPTCLLCPYTIQTPASKKRSIHAHQCPSLTYKSLNFNSCVVPGVETWQTTGIKRQKKLWISYRFRNMPRIFPFHSFHILDHWGLNLKTLILSVTPIQIFSYLYCILSHHPNHKSSLLWTVWNSFLKDVSSC